MGFQHPWAHPGHLRPCQPIPDPRGNCSQCDQHRLALPRQGIWASSLLPADTSYLASSSRLTGLSACGSVGTSGWPRGTGPQGLRPVVYMLVFKQWNFLPVCVEERKADGPSLDSGLEVEPFSIIWRDLGSPGHRMALIFYR